MIKITFQMFFEACIDINILFLNKLEKLPTHNIFIYHFSLPDMSKLKIMDWYCMLPRHADIFQPPYTTPDNILDLYLILQLKP